MIHKAFPRTNGPNVARVTFTLPRSTKSETVYLVGNFNDWNPTSHPLESNGDGSRTLTLDLELRRAYQFRYLRDGGEWMHDSQADAYIGGEWMNDSQADAYVYGRNGTYNFIVITDPDYKRYDGA